MKRTHFDEKNDARIAADAGPDKRLMCSATGCPNLWSTSVGHLCRWHADAEPRDWPAVTQAQQWDENDRARARGEPEPPATEAWTAEQKREVLRRLAALPAKWRAQDPKDWARRLRQREASGEQLQSHLKFAWRSALGVTQETRA